MLAVPSKDTPPIVLAVVNLAADATDLVESDVLSTFPNPTSPLTKVTTPVLPATESTAPDVIYMNVEPDHLYDLLVSSATYIFPVCLSPAGRAFYAVKSAASITSSTYEGN